MNDDLILYNRPCDITMYHAKRQSSLSKRGYENFRVAYDEITAILKDWGINETNTELMIVNTDYTATDGTLKNMVHLFSDDIHCEIIER